MKKLQELVSHSKDSEKISMSIAKVMQEVFPGISIKIDSISQDIDLIKAIQDDTQFLIEENNIAVPHDLQGHGVQRQLIFSALKEYSKQLQLAKSTAKKPDINLDEKSNSTRKKYMILLEEPELFLHPTAIRSVRNLLYDLAKNSEFQIICATHSPVIIDLAQSQNSLVRIVKIPEIGSISHQVKREELIAPRMLETFNPHVCEAFFADQVILVEGSTEAIAIRQILEKMELENSNSKDIKNFHIVNCGGKTTIPEFQRILRLFKIEYTVFHDSDSRLDKNGKSLNVWTINEKIWKEIEMARRDNIEAKRFVSIINFESSNGYNPCPQSKPTEAYQQVKTWISRWNEKAIQAKPIIKYMQYLVHGYGDIEDHTQAWLNQQSVESVPENFMDEQLDLW
ncbi:ATP-dependent nuclease [Prochlorothrix hollandica]